MKPDTQQHDRRNGRTELERIPADDAVAGQTHGQTRDRRETPHAPSDGFEDRDTQDDKNGDEETETLLVADGGQTRAHDTAVERGWSNVDPRSDEEKARDENLVRYADRRATFLRQNYGMDERHAATLAWRELGFSSSGIAQMMDKTEGTVSSYLDDLRDEGGAGYVDGVPAAFPVGDRDPKRPIPALTEGI